MRHGGEAAGHGGRSGGATRQAWSWRLRVEREEERAVGGGWPRSAGGVKLAVELARHGGGAAGYVGKSWS